MTNPPPDLEARRAILRRELERGEALLDLGCGRGLFLAVAWKAGVQAIGVDVDPEALEEAGRAYPGADLRLAGDGTIPLADSSVDVVWASEVLEHVADTAALLSEVRRVLRSGGRLLATTPYHGRVKSALIALSTFERHHDPFDEHVRFYSRRSLRAALEAFGFGEIALSTLGGPPLLRRTLVARAVRLPWTRA